MYSSAPLSKLLLPREDHNNPYIQIKELVVIEHYPSLRHTHLEPLLQARYKLKLFKKDSITYSCNLGQPDALVLELSTSRCAVTPSNKDIQLIQRLRSLSDLQSVPIFLITDISAWIYLERLSYRYWPVVIVDRAGESRELQYQIDSYFHRLNRKGNTAPPQVRSQTFCSTSLFLYSRTYSIIKNADLL